MRISRILLLATLALAARTAVASELVEVTPTRLTPARVQAAIPQPTDTSQVEPASAQLDDPVPAATDVEAAPADIPEPSIEANQSYVEQHDSPGLLNLGKGGKGGKGGLCCAPCFELCGWTTYADFILLQREGGTSPRVLFTDNFDGDEPVANRSNLEFGSELGFRLGAIAHNNCGADLEIIYFGADNFSATLAQDGDVNQYTQARLHGQNPLDVDSFNIRYETDLDSFEVHFRHCYRQYLTLLSGFRYIDLDDSLAIHDTFTAGAFEIDETILTTAQNRLFGFQIGADLAMVQSCKSRLNLVAKSGVYYNDFEVDSTWDFFFSEFSDSDGHVAFSGEVILSGTYDITPCLHVRGGYQVTWIQGVALGSEHIDAINHNFVPSEGDVDTSDILFHGGFLGVEWVR